MTPESKALVFSPCVTALFEIRFTFCINMEERLWLEPEAAFSGVRERVQNVQFCRVAYVLLRCITFSNIANIGKLTNHLQLCIVNE